MARVIVLGGTGRTGRLLIEQLKQRGDTVVAVFRDVAKSAEISALGAEPVILDLAKADVSDLAQAMKAGDAVIFAAGTRENEDNVDEIDRDASIKSATAAQQVGIRRFVQISAMGSRNGPPEGLDEKMQAYYRAKQQGDQHLMSTDLDWTIIEPGELTEDAGTSRVRLADEIGEGKIARADLAAVAVAALDQPISIKRAFEVIAGDEPVDQALKHAS
jgi:uncharacterized protein YbjT (DUF2867 family)